MRARYDDLLHAHLAIAVQGPTCYDEESITLSVAQKIIGSWDRTYGAGKNLAGKLAAACSEFGAAHSFHSFYHKYSDNGLWYVLSMSCILLRSITFVFVRLCLGARKQPKLEP